MSFTKPILCIFLFLFFFETADGVILEVENLNQFKQVVSSSDQETLVIFDVDNVLIIPDDPIWRPCGKPLLKKLIAETLENPAVCPKDKYSSNYLMSQFLLTRKVSLVDKETLSIVKDLQRRGVPTIALTASFSGNFGAIARGCDWRVNELKKLGFDFSLSFSKVGFIQFPKANNKEFYPVFQSGILFSSQHPKGETLHSFLKAIHWYPKQVIFIDDRLDFLQSVEQVMQKCRIKFIGFHYTAAQKLPCTVDEKLAEFQFRYLIQHGEWLSQEEAESLFYTKR